jgi:hypothetical protein
VAGGDGGQAEARRLQDGGGKPFRVAVGGGPGRRDKDPRLDHVPGDDRRILRAEEGRVEAECGRAETHPRLERAAADEQQARARVAERADGLDQVVDALLFDEATDEEQVPSLGRGRRPWRDRDPGVVHAHLRRVGAERDRRVPDGRGDRDDQCGPVEHGAQVAPVADALDAAGVRLLRDVVAVQGDHQRHADLRGRAADQPPVAAEVGVDHGGAGGPEHPAQRRRAAGQA